MLVSTMVSQSSRSQDCAGSVPSARPALLIRPRRVANSSGRLSTAALIAARSRTSRVSGSTRVFAESSPARACRRSSRRPVSTSDQPASAKRRAQASPKPEVAPVMNRVDDMGISSYGAEKRCPGILEPRRARLAIQLRTSLPRRLLKKRPTSRSPHRAWAAANSHQLVHRASHSFPEQLWQRHDHALGISAPARALIIF